MALRTKILLSLIAIAIIPLALFGVVAYTSSTNNLRSVERDALKSGLDSANHALNDIQNNLARYLHDYAQWDDLHNVAVKDTPDTDWITTNLSPETPTSTANTFNLDLVGLWNYQNKLLYNLGPIDQMASQLTAAIASAPIANVTQSVLIPIGSDVYTVSVSAIRTSVGDDPKGVLLFGRRLGAQDSQAIAALIGYDMALYKGTHLIAGPQNQKLAPDINNLNAVAADKTYHFAQDNQDYALAYAPILDKDGNEVATLVMWRPRAALQASQAAIQTTFSLAFAVGAILAILVAVLLGRSIVAPLIQMASHANRITTGDLNQQIDVHSLPRDELMDLATAFNGMTAQLARNIGELNHHVKEIDEKNRALEIANGKAEEMVRIRSEFMATMSHELRTPLNAIIGFSDVLLMGVGGTLSQVQKHHVERLKDNGKRLLALVNDVLDISRIEAGRIELAEEPFEAGQMISQITAQMQILAEQKQIAFITEVSPELPSTLVGDKKRIEQVIVNLLSNAFKFTEHGSVSFKVAVLPNNMWSMAVRDTGIGIPPHALDLIFEPFRQVDGTSKRAYSGSGLGLAIAQQLIQGMGGKITVESELTKGSTFTVVLPIVIPVITETSIAQTEAA